MASARHLVFHKWPVPKSQKHTLDHTQTGPYLPLLKCQPLLSMRKICLPLLTKLPVAPRNAYARRCRFAVRLRSGSQLNFVARTPSPSPYATHTLAIRAPKKCRGEVLTRLWPCLPRRFSIRVAVPEGPGDFPACLRMRVACGQEFCCYLHATAMARAGCLLTN